jgi:hypothetical protein
MNSSGRMRVTLRGFVYQEWSTSRTSRMLAGPQVLSSVFWATQVSNHNAAIWRHSLMKWLGFRREKLLANTGQSL